MDKNITLENLFNSLRPAFLVKIRLMKKKKLDYIKMEDIWNYLRMNKWREKKELTISEMVSDIIHVSYFEVLDFVNQNIYSMERVLK